MARPASSEPGTAENPGELELPLQSILENLPPQLHARLTLTDTDLGRASISISVEKIMPQLASGVVKITFGELRQAAPSLFNIDEEYDSLPVVLPLSKVLARLSSNSLVRNPAQKHIEVPAEITGPFTGRGEGVSISKTPTKPAPAPAPPVRMATPAPRTPVKTAPPVAPPPPAFIPRAIKPEPPVPLPSRNGNGSGNGLPVPPIIPGLPIQPPSPTLPRAPKPAPLAPRLMPFTPKPAPVTPESAAIQAPLAALSENWPDTLRREIAQLISANAQVALPVNLVEPALKRGRVIFAWRNLRSWTKPTPAAVSIHDGLELELPLKVIAPLFLARRGGAAKMAPPHPSASLPAEIPNLFFGFPQPQSPAETPEPPGQAPPPDETHFAAKSADAKSSESNSNYYVWGDTSDMPQLDTPQLDTTEYRRAPAPVVPATDFSSRQTTPKEVIARAMALKGVAGALVALPDGLMVASQIPSDLNADTLAAFLPQIYGRVSQCTKELRMGELNNLNFTVGNVPWKVFRIHGVYFAAFGRAGEQLPTTQLAQLAGELDRKK